MKSNPIILIDDDEDDCELFKDACAESNVQNEVIVFNISNEAFDYLSSMKEQPLFIVCDVNMALVNGLELRQKINVNERLRLRAVPFLFWSTSGKYRYQLKPGKSKFVLKFNLTGQERP